MIRRIPVALFFALSLPVDGAIQHDFGQGLHYVRIADLTRDSSELKSALTQEAVILDLRNAKATADAADGLALKLDQPPPGVHGVRIILINPSSAASIVEAVTHPHPRELTVGPKTPALAPDIAVPITPEEDRKAYEALETGTLIDKLIASNPDKRRFDEAALAHNHNNGGGADAENDRDDEPDSLPAKPVVPADPAHPVVPHDLVLGRAVQIYKAVIAAKK